MHLPCGSSLVLIAPLHVHRSQASVPCPGEWEQKKWLLRAHILTKAREGYSSHNWGVFEFPAVAEAASSCNRLWHVHSGGSVSQCPWRQEPTCGGGSSLTTHHVPLNNCVSLSRQNTLPLGMFPAAYTLTPIPSAASTQPITLLSLDPFSKPML